MFSRLLGLAPAIGVNTIEIKAAQKERAQNVLAKPLADLTPEDKIYIETNIESIRQIVLEKKDEIINLNKLTSAYNELKSVSSSLASALAPLRTPPITSDSVFELRTVSVTTNDNNSKTYLNVSAGASAAINSYQVYISKLATSSTFTLKPATLSPGPTPYTTSTYPVVEATTKALKFGAGSGKIYVLHELARVGFSAKSIPEKDQYAVNFTVGQSLDSVCSSFSAIYGKSRINASLNNTSGNIYRLTFSAASQGSNNNIIILDDANGDVDVLASYFPTGRTLGVNLFTGKDAVASTLSFGKNASFDKGLMSDTTSTIVTSSHTANKFLNGDVYLFQDSSGNPQAAWDSITLAGDKENYKYAFDSSTKSNYSLMTTGQILNPHNSATYVSLGVANDTKSTFDFKGTTDNIYLFDGLNIESRPDAIFHLEMLEDHSGGNHYIRFGIDKKLVDPFDSNSGIVSDSDVAGEFKTGTIPIRYQNNNYSLTINKDDWRSLVTSNWNNHLSGSGLTVSDSTGFITITENIAAGNPIEISDGALKNPLSIKNVAYVSKTGTAQTTFSLFYDFDITGTTGGGGPAVDYFFEDINTTPVVTTVATNGKLTAGDLYIYQGNWSTLNGLSNKNSYKVALSNGDKLQDVVNKINIITNTTKVAASIITNNSSDHRLQLSSTNTGIISNIKLYDSNGADGAPLITSKMDLTPIIGSDATIIVNGGAPLTRSSNTISDAISGLTLTLLNTNTNNSKYQTINVAYDRNAVLSNFNDFVSFYNNFKTFAAKQFEYKAESPTIPRNTIYKDSAILHSESLFNYISDYVSRESISTVKELTNSDLRALTDIGFKFVTLPANPSNYTPEVKNALSFVEADFDTALVAKSNDWSLVKKVFVFTLECSTPGLDVHSHSKNISRTNVKITVNTTGVAGAPNGEKVKFEFYDQATSTNVDLTEFADLISIQGVAEPIITPKSTEIYKSVIDGVLLKYTPNVASGNNDVFDHVKLYQGIADRLYNTLNEATKTTTGQIDSKVFSIIKPSSGILAIEQSSYNSMVTKVNSQIETLKENINKKITSAQTAKSMVEYYEKLKIGF